MALDENLDALHSRMGLSSPEDGGSRSYPMTAGHGLLTISEMARQSGATPRALRFY